MRQSPRSVLLMILSAIFATSLFAAAAQSSLPAAPNSLKFAVVGDSGTGDRPQFEVGDQMAAVRQRFPFELVIMVGDNIYGRQQPQDFVDKFERPFAALLRAGVSFHASLGNHDDERSRFYRSFNMGGELYYTFARKNVRFFVLNSNQMDPRQRAWLEEALKESKEDWKFCYFHHPLYSDGRRHGSDVGLRVTLEPLFVKYGVNVVFAGHDHIYERLKPQRGITHFVAGSTGELRRGDVNPSAATAAYFDQDQAFLLVEVGGDTVFFQAVARTGAIVDSGVISRGPPRA